MSFSIGTFIGIISGIGLFIYAIITGGASNPMVFIHPNSFIMVVGGTIAATFIAFKENYVLQAFSGIGSIFKHLDINSKTLYDDVGKIIGWGEIMKKGGLQDLQNKFDRVTIARDNQDVVDNCDWIVLAVLPKVAQKILSSLEFRANQRVLSLIATLSANDLSDLVAPASDIFRVVPLPTAAEHLGPIALCPPDPKIAELMNRIGYVVQVEDEDRFYALWSLTALMAPYFALLGTTTEWLIKKGIDKPAAKQYVGSMFAGLSAFGTEIRSNDFVALIREPVLFARP